MSSRLSFSFTLPFLSFVAYVFVSKFSPVQQFDWAVLEWTHSLKSISWKYALVPFAVMGSIEFSVSLLFLFSLWIYEKKEYQKAYLILAGLLLLTAIEFMMKQNIHHPRVPIQYRQGRFPFIAGVGTLEIETNYSFPSGHAIRTAFLLGAAFLWSRFSRTGKVGIVLIVAFLVLQLTSMNYYGFHWPSEIIGGYWLAFTALYYIGLINNWNQA